MAVIIPPPRQTYLRRFGGLAVFTLLAIAAGFFICYRFGETTLEKAERLYSQRKLTQLRDFAQARLAAGEVSPILLGHYAVAEFSTNAKSNLLSLMNNIAAADSRVIFRREALVRIADLKENTTRAGDVMQQALKLEVPMSSETKQVVTSLLKSSYPLNAAELDFKELSILFPEAVRQVKARELQFRAAGSTEGAVLRRLKDGETLLLRTTGELTTVSGKKGRWIYALDSHLESGWVFDAYLERID